MGKKTSAKKVTPAKKETVKKTSAKKSTGLDSVNGCRKNPHFEEIVKIEPVKKETPPEIPVKKDPVKKETPPEIPAIKDPVKKETLPEIKLVINKEKKGWKTKLIKMVFTQKGGKISRSTLAGMIHSDERNTHILISCIKRATDFGTQIIGWDKESKKYTY